MIISLCGFMGAGKSTIGKHLANWLGFRFTDLDSYIEKKFGCTVSAFFARTASDSYMLRHGVDEEGRVLTGSHQTSHVYMLQNYQLAGHHVFGKWDVDWSGSYSITSSSEPDRRQVMFQQMSDGSWDLFRLNRQAHRALSRGDAPSYAHEHRHITDRYDRLSNDRLRCKGIDSNNGIGIDVFNNGHICGKCQGLDTPSKYPDTAAFTDAGREHQRVTAQSSCIGRYFFCHERLLSSKHNVV